MLIRRSLLIISRDSPAAAHLMIGERWMTIARGKGSRQPKVNERSRGDAPMLEIAADMNVS
jgi:hypothetical protein